MKEILDQETLEHEVASTSARMNIEDWQLAIHSSSYNAGWWDDADVDEVTPTKIALIHSEVSEALEGFRKGIMDDHLPHRTMAEVELADVIIRVLDLAGAHEMDILGAVKEKLQYNWNRADHKREARAAAGGKKF